jgi:hypothetical protein
VCIKDISWFSSLSEMLSFCMQHVMKLVNKSHVLRSMDVILKWCLWGCRQEWNVKPSVEVGRVISGGHDLFVSLKRGEIGSVQCGSFRRMYIFIRRGMLPLSYIIIHIHPPSSKFLTKHDCMCTWYMGVRSWTRLWKDKSVFPPSHRECPGT